ncbi:MULTISPECIES: MFS transporter [unclassified Bartonella]|uniref:MFS transporter n=1 Tax=unclassified Bartonella TaxID=2645622 RepID=UPI0015F887E0|nr:MULTISPECIES: MFS transporter [unclassified Bartonella]UXN04528.1 MFS transporter [Bartonella sp. HY406]
MAFKIHHLSADQSFDDKTRKLSQLAFAMGGFSIGTAEFVIMGLLPEVAKATNVDMATAGHFVSFYASGVVVGAPLLAVLTAKMPRKMLLIAFMIFYAIGNILSACVSTYDQFSILRFLSGLPHGIYFGVAAIAAASMVEARKRAQAVGSVMLGLTVATVIGAPGGTLIGQLFGWRIAFFLVGFLALFAAFLIWRFVPNLNAAAGASPLRELSALKNGQLWLFLAIIAIGSGGLFAVFTYIKPILTDVSHIDKFWVPFVLPLFGVGMVAGNLIGPKIAYRMGLMPSIFVTTLWGIFVFIIFGFMVENEALAVIATFLIGTSFISQPSVQTKIIEVSANAPTLATALMQSSFNVANALGAFLGGLVIVYGYGLEATAWLGAFLVFLGFLVFLLAWHIEKKQIINEDKSKID